MFTVAIYVQSKGARANTTGKKTTYVQSRNLNFPRHSAARGRPRPASTCVVAPPPCTSSSRMLGSGRSALLCRTELNRRAYGALGMPVNLTYN